MDEATAGRGVQSRRPGPREPCGARAGASRGASSVVGPVNTPDCSKHCGPESSGSFESSAETHRAVMMGSRSAGPESFPERKSQDRQARPPRPGPPAVPSPCRTPAEGQTPSPAPPRSGPGLGGGVGEPGAGTPWAGGPSPAREAACDPSQAVPVPRPDHTRGLWGRHRQPDVTRPTEPFPQGAGPEWGAVCRHRRGAEC